MPRRAHSDPPRALNIQLPSSLVDEIDLLLFDPARGRIRYGARSSLIAQLLREWVDKRKREPAEETEQKIGNLSYGTDPERNAT